MTELGLEAPPPPPSFTPPPITVTLPPSYGVTVGVVEVAPPGVVESRGPLGDGVLPRRGGAVWLPGWVWVGVGDLLEIGPPKGSADGGRDPGVRSCAALASDTDEATELVDPVPEPRWDALVGLEVEIIGVEEPRG
jgi:hypothetical protein